MVKTTSLIDLQHQTALLGDVGLVGDIGDAGHIAHAAPVIIVIQDPAQSTASIEVYNDRESRQESRLREPHRIVQT